jgi:phosphoribosylanthranilate isomerase
MKIKICGIKNEADAEAVNICKPDLCGFIFAPSKRRITPFEAMRLRMRIDDNIKIAGVFTDTPIEDIAVLYEYNIIQYAQLHGGQSNDFLTALKLKCPIPIIQVIRSDSSDSPNKIADFWLYDGAVGGAGKRFDWSKITDISKPWFLAGGINASNIDEAIAMSPYCIDIASGAEDRAGRKDAKKMKILIDRVRGVENAK